jgi:hypothetical protein
MRLLTLLMAIGLATTARAEGSPDEPRWSTVPVTFVNRRAGPAYRILVERQFCSTPCVLTLAPGPHTVLVASNAAQRELPLEVPDRPARATIETPNPVQLMLGILGSIYGTGLLGGGVAIAASRLNEHELIGGTLIGCGVLLAVAGVVALATLRGPHLSVTPD